jgi:hypothetical protein
VVYPDVDLWFMSLSAAVWRGIAALVGLLLLLWGLIWDSE